MVENETNSEASLAPELWLLLQAWRTRVNLKDHPPGPAEFVPALPPRWLGSVALIAPGARSGFVVRTCGYDLIRRFGRFAAGDRVASLATGIARPLGARLRIALRTGAPVVWRPVVMLGRDPTQFSELILPLAPDGEGTALLLLAAREERRPRRKPPPEPQFCLPDWERD